MQGESNDVLCSCTKNLPIQDFCSSDGNGLCIELADSCHHRRQNQDQVRALLWKESKICESSPRILTLGVVTIASRDMQPKVEYRGIDCLMGGCATDHAGDVYKMYDPIVNVIYRTRDMKWHLRMYFEDARGTVVELPEYPITTVEESITTEQNDEGKISSTTANIQVNKTKLVVSTTGNELENEENIEARGVGESKIVTPTRSNLSNRKHMAIGKYPQDTSSSGDYRTPCNDNHSLSGGGRVTNYSNSKIYSNLNIVNSIKFCKIAGGKV